MFLIFQKAGSSTMMLKYKEFQESAKKTKDILDKLPLDSKRDHVQFTILDAQFVMSGKMNISFVHSIAID